jgi:hypothetical protein
MLEDDYFGRHELDRAGNMANRPATPIGEVTDKKHTYLPHSHRPQDK